MLHLLVSVVELIKPIARKSERLRDKADEFIAEGCNLCQILVEELLEPGKRFFFRPLRVFPMSKKHCKGL